MHDKLIVTHSEDGLHFTGKATLPARCIPARWFTDDIASLRSVLALGRYDDFDVDVSHDEHGHQLTLSLMVSRFDEMRACEELLKLQQALEPYGVECIDCSALRH